MKTALQCYRAKYGADSLIDDVALEFARAFAEQVRDECVRRGRGVTVPANDDAYIAAERVLAAIGKIKIK